MDNETEQLPYVPDGVITYLERTFPNTIPLKEQSMFQYGRLAGIEEVKQHLQQVKIWSENKNV